MEELADTAVRGFLPERYLANWRKPFDDLTLPFLNPGVRVLDFGGGAKPIVGIENRPEQCCYVGIDVSRDELERAPVGSYDELIVGEIASGLVENKSFDLVVSWQVLEHVEDLRATLEAVRSALVPGGALVAQFSGSRAVFAVLNRLIPSGVGELAMDRLLGREPDSVFTAHYDHCTGRGIAECAAEWSELTIIPRYRGATYFGFSSLLARTYLVYEEWLVRNGRSELATHYLIRMVK